MSARPFYEGIRAASLVASQRLILAEQARADIPWWAFIRHAQADARLEEARSANKQLHFLLRLANHHPNDVALNLVNRMNEIGYSDAVPNEVFDGEQLP